MYAQRTVFANIGLRLTHYCLKTGQIIFDPYDWQFPPDIILPATLDTTFDIEQLAADDWDIRDRTCLFKYIMQLRELFIVSIYDVQPHIAIK